MTHEIPTGDPLTRRFTRRDFLKGAASLTTLLALDLSLVACGESEKKYDAKGDLKSVIEGLHGSRLKELLDSVVVPHLTVPNSTLLNIDGIQVPIISPTVSRIIKASNVRYDGAFNGTYNPRGNKATLDRLFPLADTEIQVPVPFLLDDEELETLGPEGRLLNGTPRLKLLFETTRPIDDGDNPEIKVYLPHSDTVPADRKVALQSAYNHTLLKESCGFLWRYLVERVVTENMYASNISPELLARDKNNRQRLVQILTQIMDVLRNRGGRFLALGDMGAYVLAFKAMENTRDYDIIKRYTNSYSPVMNELESLDIGQSPEEIVTRVSRYILNSPTAQRNLVHMGDLSILP